MWKWLTQHEWECYEEQMNEQQMQNYMEQQLFKTLPYKTIAEVTNESVSYIQARKDRTIVPLKTRWKSSISLLWRIRTKYDLTIAGGSGSGNQHLQIRLKLI